MADLFGYDGVSTPFVDIRNQRDSVADEKAQLCKKLNELLRKAPESLGSASVQVVREWRGDHARSLKILQSKRSSRVELGLAIKLMQKYMTGESCG